MFEFANTEAEDDSAAITIHKISFSFKGLDRVPNLIFADLSLSIHQGGIHALMGPSGCGKTTLLRILSGLLVPDTGEILFRNRPQGKKGFIGLVQQRDTLFPWLTVWDNIAFGMINNKDGDRIRQTIQAVGLAGSERYYPNELSGGMRQRVALARCLAPSPSALLLDEPFVSLDYPSRSELHRLIEHVILDTPIPVVLVTHDPDEAVRLADFVTVLSAKPASVIATSRLRFNGPREQHGKRSPEFEAARNHILDQLEVAEAT